MIAVDTNVLVAAHREEHPMHATALARLRELAADPMSWALPVVSIAEFLRVVTHPKVFSPPSSLEVAGTFVDHLVTSPNLRLLLPGPRFWARLRRVVHEADARGNLAFDAQIAAVCEEHGVRELVTGDRDFARFPRLRPLYL